MLSNKKHCRTCDKTKDLSEFHKNTTKNIHCKECTSVKSKEYTKTKDGLISRIYAHQKHKSKLRNHVPPSYSKEEFSIWITDKGIFHRLFRVWSDSSHHKKLTPSCDRIDYRLPYTPPEHDGRKR